MDFKCQYCEYVTLDYDWLIDHAWDHHRLDYGFSFECYVSGCLASFTCKRSYKNHIRRKHTHFHETCLNNRSNGGDSTEVPPSDFRPDDSDAAATAADYDDYDDDDDDDPDHVQPDSVMHDDNSGPAESNSHRDINRELSDLDDFDYETNIADLLVELREKFGVTNVAVTFIAERISAILKHDTRQRAKKFSHSLKINNLDLDFQSETVLTSDSPFISPLERFSNTCTLDRFIASKSQYVAPIEVPLDGSDKLYYVPLKETLKQILSKEDVFDEVLDYGNGKVPGVISDFSDGDVYKNNELFQAKPKSLQIGLYHDDFQTLNPLGNKTKDGKFSSFYFILGNLRPEHRSRLKDIHMLTLTNATNIAKYGYESTLAPLVKDLRSLEEDGLEFDYNNVTFRVYGTISVVIGDNLAVHSLGGFYENFSTVQRFCRTCNRTMDSINDHTFCDVIRTKEAYDAQVAFILTDPSMIPLYGIKRPCVLNDLRFFHIMDGAPGDIAHDIFEGFAQDYFCQLLVHYIRQRIFTLEKVNNIILSFEYAAIDKNNKPQPIKDKPLTVLKIKYTACEMWNFIRLFPLMFGGYIDEMDEHWKLCLSFIILVEKLCAHAFNAESLRNLDQTIRRFIYLYSELYPEVNVKPKLHFLTHYPLNIKKFGPLAKTLRFESKHSYFKNCITKSKNRKNMAYSMVRHHQMMMYLEYKKTKYFGDDEMKLTSSHEVRIKDLPAAVQELCASCLFVYGSSLTEAEKVTYKGQCYSSGSAVVYGKQNAVLLIGEIVHVYVCGKIPLILCDKLFYIYDEHLNAYSVKRTGHYSLLRLYDLYDYHPLGVYCLDGRYFVNLRHSIM